ncbi:serine/threonine-protein kinase 33-like [Chrysoperla carnea]|uniref:serine/threonine-protein kinase 33-like n=1 Tax=Chrysoperla carnea TaxID=189513 RepID=UPI001D078BF8|nr:serine/threonine-protein kinase 33-like [Chrysoperla carnea]
MCLLPYTKYIMQNEKTVLCGNQVYVHQRITDASDLKHYYNFGQKLGNGCFGIVVQAQEKLTEKKWAIKIILKSKANETLGGESFRSIEREIIILKMVNHPHIIHLEKVFESPKKIYLILELCREELATAFKKKKRFTEDETRYVLKQLVSAGPT